MIQCYSNLIFYVFTITEITIVFHRASIEDGMNESGNTQCLQDYKRRTADVYGMMILMF